MKRTTIFLVAILLLFSFTSCNKEDSPNFELIDYRYDVEPLISRFPYFQSIESVCWKTSVIGSTNFGPSSYTIKAFIIISIDEHKSIVDSYAFEPAYPEFEKGLDPTITGVTSFQWMENSDFTRDVLGVDFIGNVFLDKTSGIIYIDVESI